MTPCGKCQWNCKNCRCTFYQPPLGGETPQKGHRRGRSSTSSLGSQLGISIHSALLATERNIALVELQQILARLEVRSKAEFDKLEALRDLMQGPNAVDMAGRVSSLISTSNPVQTEEDIEQMKAIIERLRTL